MRLRSNALATHSALGQVYALRPDPARDRMRKSWLCGRLALQLTQVRSGRRSIAVSCLPARSGFGLCAFGGSLCLASNIYLPFGQPCS